MGTEQIRGISAVTLLTSDMEAVTRFYEAMGFVAARGGPESTFTTYRVGGTCLNLELDRDRAGRTIWGRVVFLVGDVDHVHQMALAAGYRPATQPANARWGERYFHILDPDGHELSFAQPLSSLP